MLTKVYWSALISDQLYTWSDEYPERTRCHTAETPQRSCASTAPPQIDPAWFPHRALQTMWQAGMQMRRRPRTWPQILSVGELSRAAAANGLRAAGGLWANGGVPRQLSSCPRDSGDDLRDQPRTAAPSRGALTRHHERSTACPPRPDRFEIGQRASRQYACRLARRQ